MRKRNHGQLPLMDSGIEHPRVKELEQISQILDKIPTINEMLLQDLTQAAGSKNYGPDPSQGDP